MSPEIVVLCFGGLLLILDMRRKLYYDEFFKRHNISNPQSGEPKPPKREYHKEV